MASLNGLTVEVRDENLVRKGVIMPKDLDLRVQDLYVAPGDWELHLRADHPLAETLRTPGSGIVVSTDDEEVFSGPMTQAEISISVDDPIGTVMAAGRSDGMHVQNRLAWADPDSPIGSQTKARDLRTGPCETLMHGYVNDNLGPGALVERRLTGLTMGTDLGRGPTVTKRSRFHELDVVLGQLALRGNLGYRIIQRGSGLKFETYAVRDRTNNVRLNVQTGTLAAARFAEAAPGATHVIVGGQGIGTNRTFIVRSDAGSEAAEALWGWRVERWADQKQTDELSELQQAGDEVLDEDGETRQAMQIVPASDSEYLFNRDFRLGDEIAVIFGASEYLVTITGYRLFMDKDGVRLGLLVGDETVFTKTPRPDQPRPKGDPKDGKDGSSGRDTDTSIEVPTGWDGETGIGGGGIGIYVQPDEPLGVPIGTLWFDTDDFSV